MKACRSPVASAFWVKLLTSLISAFSPISEVTLLLSTSTDTLRPPLVDFLPAETAREPAIMRAVLPLAAFTVMSPPRRLTVAFFPSIASTVFLSTATAKEPAREVPLPAITEPPMASA